MILLSKFEGMNVQFIVVFVLLTISSILKSLVGPNRPGELVVILILDNKTNKTGKTRRRL